MDAMIVGITDHQGVVIIHAHAGGIRELSKSSTNPTTLFAQLLNQTKGVTRVVDADHMQWVTTRDMQVSMQVHAHAFGMSTKSKIGEVLTTIATPHRHSTVAVLSHTPDGGRRGREARVQIADSTWPIQLLVTSSFLAKGGDEATRGVQELNSMMVSVSHRDVSIGSTTHSLWLVELTFRITSILACSSNGIQWSW